MNACNTRFLLCNTLWKMDLAELRKDDKRC